MKKKPKGKSNAALFKLLDQNTRLIQALHRKGGKAPRASRSPKAKKQAMGGGGPAPKQIWTANEVWEALRNHIIPPPPVGKQTPMEAVLLRISVGLLAQRINVLFFPNGGGVSVGEISVCETAGHLWVLICNHLAAQGRLA